jgi:hypothetical protein
VIRRFADFLASPLWSVLSLACALYGLFEAIRQLIAGRTVEGLLDLVLLIVFLVNFVNRFTAIGRYFRRLQRRERPST